MNENTYSSQQAQKLKSQADLFSVSQIGQTLVISSLKNQLWVEWHTDGTVEIGVGSRSDNREITIFLSCPSHQAGVLKASVVTSMVSTQTTELAGQERWHFIHCFPIFSIRLW